MCLESTWEGPRSGSPFPALEARQASSEQEPLHGGKTHEKNPDLHPSVDPGPFRAGRTDRPPPMGNRTRRDGCLVSRRGSRHRPVGPGQERSLPRSPDWDGQLPYSRRIRRRKSVPGSMVVPDGIRPSPRHGLRQTYLAALGRNQLQGGHLRQRYPDRPARGYRWNVPSLPV